MVYQVLIQENSKKLKIKSFKLQRTALRYALISIDYFYNKSIGNHKRLIDSLKEMKQNDLTRKYNVIYLITSTDKAVKILREIKEVGGNVEEYPLYREINISIKRNEKVIYDKKILATIYKYL